MAEGEAGYKPPVTSESGRQEGAGLHERLARIGPHPDNIFQMLLDLQLEKGPDLSPADYETLWNVAYAYGVLAQHFFAPTARFAFWNTVNVFYRGEPNYLTGHKRDNAEIVDKFVLTDDQAAILKQIADQTHVSYSGEQRTFDFSSIPHAGEVRRQADEWNDREWERIQRASVNRQQPPQTKGK